MDEHHRRLIEIGLSAAAQHGFALAGGYAVQAHDIVNRVSEDVDLFAPYERRVEMLAAADHTIEAFRAAGFLVDTEVSTDTYVKLWVSDPATNPTADQEYATKVELVATPLTHAPVNLAIGPVLHRDDVATGKMNALYTRAAARDYIDVGSMLAGGLYTREKLTQLAAAADAGFDARYFAEMLARMVRYDDEDFLRYEITPQRLDAVRTEIAKWHRQLTRDHPERPAPQWTQRAASPSIQSSPRKPMSGPERSLS